MFPIERYRESASFLEKKLNGFAPELLIVLGSGLGYLAEQCENATTIPFKEIPHFQEATIVGHAGALTFGVLGGRRVALMQGRMHMYEGNSAEQSAFAIGVFRQLGIRVAILTNAAGGVNLSFSAGDLMLIQDQINLFDTTPLWGKNCDELGVRFPDMSTVYSERLQRIAREAARLEAIPLREGVYFYMRGPQYETPAEIRAIRVLGGDAVGMSTVNEAIAATHCGMEVLGLSLISNMAAGIDGKALSHEEVTANATDAYERFSRLLLRVIPDA